MNTKFQLIYIKACRRIVRKTVYIQHSKFRKIHNSFKNWPQNYNTQLDLYCSSLKKVRYKILATYVKASRKKSAENVAFQVSKFRKEHNSYKNWHKSTKHVGEKCGKLFISKILSSKRGITPTKIVENGLHSNMIWNSLNESHMHNFSSICQIM